MLRLPVGQTIPFKAGQYINIILDDGQRRAFSFANPPHQPDLIELQIRLMPGGRFTTHVFEQMKEGDTIRFDGPLGDFTLRESERPIVFVAGATGFAPVKSMVEDAFQRGLKRPIYLYWGVRRLADLYLPDLPARWDANTRTSISSRCCPSRRRKTTGTAAPAWCTRPSSPTSPTSPARKSTPAAR
jgi:CDP-4-dehydro-6-deoxyglucose reductase